MDKSLAKWLVAAESTYQLDWDVEGTEGLVGEGAAVATKALVWEEEG